MSIVSCYERENVTYSLSFATNESSYIVSSMVEQMRKMNYYYPYLFSPSFLPSLLLSFLLRWIDYDALSVVRSLFFLYSREHFSSILNSLLSLFLFLSLVSLMQGKLRIFELNRSIFNEYTRYITENAEGFSEYKYVYVYSERKGCHVY